MRRTSLALTAWLCCSFSAFATDWAPFKHDGRDYVTFENVTQFYGLGEVQRVSNNNAFSIAIGNRTLRGQSGSVELYINNLKFNLSYPVADVNGHLCVSRMDLVKVIEPVLRPGKIKDVDAVDTVILDPGHGGHDNGAVSTYGYEKTFTLDVANRARLLFLEQGYKVFLTRESDEFVGLEERVAFANRFPTGLFISIHFNSGGGGTGLETYTLAPRGVPSMMEDGPRLANLVGCPGNARDAENMALATAAHASLITHLRDFDHGMYDRGIKRARFVVIRDITVPGVLVEGGFLSNNYDARLIATPDYRQGMARSIFQAVQTYRRAVGPTAVQLAHTSPPLRPSADDSAAAGAAPRTQAPANE